MQTIRTNHHPCLAAHDLPGPDTRTKLAALEFPDLRAQLMLAEAARIGWPAAYTDDLYIHDLEVLQKNPAATLLWILRQHGTHLYPIQCDNGREAAYYRQVIRYWSGDDKLNVATCDEDRARYYIVSDAGVRPLNADKAAEAVKVRPRE